MVEYIKTWVAFKADTRAVTALEYALIAAVIAVAMIAGATTLGNNMSAAFTTLSTKV